MVNEKVIAIIQARISSSRLPAKAMLDINGKTVLTRVIDRIKKVKIIDETWIATSDTSSDNIIEASISKKDVKIFRGSLHNVFQRFIDLVKIANPTYIVRVTGDNPLTEPTFIYQAIKEIKEKNADYVSLDQIPYGSGIEVFRASSFLSIQEEELDEYDKEHVTAFLYKNPKKFKILQILPEEYLQRPDIRLTLDTLEDYIFLYNVIQKMEEDSIPLILENVLSYIDKLHS